MQDVSHFINICSIISIQILNLHAIFIEFGGDVQQNIGYPSANRGCSPFLAKRNLNRVFENLNRSPISPYRGDVATSCWEAQCYGFHEIWD